MTGAPRGLPVQAQADIALQRELLDFAYAGAGPRRWHVTRLAMYLALGDRLAGLDGPACRCLAISGSEGLARILGLGAAAVENVGYPGVDMTALPYPVAPSAGVAATTPRNASGSTCKASWCGAGSAART